MLLRELLLILPLVVAVTVGQANRGYDYYGTSNVRYQRPQPIYGQQRFVLPGRPMPTVRPVTATPVEPIVTDAPESLATTSAPAAPVAPVAPAAPAAPAAPEAPAVTAASIAPAPILDGPASPTYAPVLQPQPVYYPVNKPLLPPRLIRPAPPVTSPPQSPATAASQLPVTEAEHLVPPTEKFEVTTSQPGDVTELAPKPEPLLQPEPIRQPEPILQPEPVLQPVPIREPEPIRQPDPVLQPKPVLQPVPIREPEPIRQPEPILQPEPVLQPVPIREPEPIRQPEPVLQPEPVQQPEPVLQPVPIQEPELIRETEPIREPEPIPELAPPGQPEAILQPKPVLQPEPLALLEPVVKPEPNVQPQPNPQPQLVPQPAVLPKPKPINNIRISPPQSDKPVALLPLLPKPTSVREVIFGRPSQTSLSPINYYTTPARTVATQPPQVFTERTHPETLVTRQPLPPVTQAPGQLKSDFQCIEGNGYYSVEHECDTYIECKNNRAVKYACPDGLHFNPAAKHYEYPCAYPSEVKCMAGYQEQSPKATNTCPNQYGFYSMNDGDCSKFIMCQEGLDTIMNCPMGLVFNPQTSTCDWPANVPQCNPNVFKDFTCPEPPKDDNGNISDIIYKYRYGQQCKLYVACQLGHPRLLSCDIGLAFDHTSQSCVDEDYVTDCAVPYTNN